jgi:hypothetical protein
LAPSDDFHAQHRLVLAVVGAAVAHGLLVGAGAQQFLDAAGEHAGGLGDDDLRLGLLGLVVDAAPGADGVHLSAGGCRGKCKNDSYPGFVGAGQHRF